MEGIGYFHYTIITNVSICDTTTDKFETTFSEVLIILKNNCTRLNRLYNNLKLNNEGRMTIRELSCFIPTNSRADCKIQQLTPLHHI